MSDEADGPSAVEHIKERSDQLRFLLVDEFAAGGNHIRDEAYQVLKFHGSYQQDDRDVRAARRKSGEEYAFGFMIRLRIPGGDIHPALWLALDRLAGRYGRDTLRLTTRQSVQLHFIPKGDLKAVIRAVSDVTAIPVSALYGDNVVERSAAMPWFDGTPPLEHLESVCLDPLNGSGPFRLPIQWVIRAGSADDPDYRAYAGRIEAGRVRPGDDVVALPSGISTRVAAIDTFDGPLEEASTPQSVAVRLTDDVDLGRGGLLASVDAAPAAVRELDAFVCWLGDVPFTAGRRYRLAHTSRMVRAAATEIVARFEINTLARDMGAVALAANDVGHVRLTLAEPIFADRYRSNRSTGSAILIDEASNATVGAVLVHGAGEEWP